MKKISMMLLIAFFIAINCFGIQLGPSSSAGYSKALEFTGAQSISSTTVSGSKTVTVASTSTLKLDMSIRGTGIDGICYITEIVDSTTFTISKDATASAANALTYGDYFAQRDTVGFVHVLLVGGGGGGNDGSNVGSIAGGGGGGGEVVFGLVNVTTDIAVTLGSGGTGSGTNGSDSTFGSLLTASLGVGGGSNGGDGGGRQKGSYYDGASWIASYTNGVASITDPLRKAGDVGGGSFLTSFGGAAGGTGYSGGQDEQDGGDNFLGFSGGAKGDANGGGGGGASYGDGGAGSEAGSPGSPGSGYGSGGGGGYGAMGGSQNGGAGADGYCIVFWNE